MCLSDEQIQKPICDRFGPNFHSWTTKGSRRRQGCCERVSVASAVTNGWDQVAPLSQLVPSFEEDKRRSREGFRAKLGIGVGPDNRVASERGNILWTSVKPHISLCPGSRVPAIHRSRNEGQRAFGSCLRPDPFASFGQDRKRLLSRVRAKRVVVESERIVAISDRRRCVRERATLCVVIVARKNSTCDVDSGQTRRLSSCA